MRVLVIESDPAIAGLLAAFLADEGHAVTGATTLDEGLARARAGSWDACLTDGFWPEVIAEARAYLADLASCCPVILLSAHDWARCARPADLGIAAVVSKPFDLDELLGVLRVATAGVRARVIARSDPGRRVSYTYTAPEFGYPGRSCRVCQQRPCTIRLGWYEGWARARVGGYAHFCAEHVAEANRACRILKAGQIPSDRSEPLWSESPVT